MNRRIKLSLIAGLALLVAIPFYGLAQIAGPADSSGSIVGKIKDEFSRAIINIDLSVFAYRQGKWVEGVFSKANGDYKIMDLPAGDWILGVHTKPESGFSASGINLPTTLAANGTTAQDIVLKRLGGIIAGRVSKPDGTPLTRALVKVTDFLSKSARTLLSAETDLNGAFRFFVPAGSYLVRAFSGAEYVVDPEPEEVILHSGEVATVSLVFDRPDRVIYGQVKIGGYGAQAPVWAWSDRGRYAETKSDVEGFYRLKVRANDRWHLTAVKDVNRLPYQSDEVIIDVQNQDVKRDLVLAAGTRYLPEAKRERFNTGSDSTMRLENGMAVSVPAYSIPTNELVINVSAALGPSQKDLRLVTPVYKITISDSLGRPVTQLGKNAILEIPYARTELPNDISEEQLKIFFWDDQALAWRPNGNSVASNGIVIGLTEHLTIFGAGFDPEQESSPTPSPTPASSAAPAGTEPSITAPLTPTNLSAVLPSGQSVSSQINLAWTDNSDNEDGFRIQRRELPNGEFAQVSSVGANATSYSNQSLSANTSYQYRVAAFNAAGNSLFSNTAQATIQPSPPNIGNVTIDTKEANRQVITWTTNEPATSNLTYRLIGSPVTTRVENPNALNVHTFPLNLAPGQVYGIILSATDLALNTTVSQEITFTVSRVPTTQTVQVQQQGPRPTPTPGAPASQLIPADVTFNRNLLLGSIDDDVRKLQEFLNRNNFPVAVSGAGSPGRESRFLGPATAAALRLFQERFRDQILTPVGLTRGTGTLGPITRAFINRLRISIPALQP